MKNYYPLRFCAVLFFIVWSAFQSRAQTELIQNGGFESGNASWTIGGGALADNTAGFSRSGTYFMFLGGVVNEVDLCYQQITIPAGAASATLTFYYNILSSDDPSFPYDTFRATIRDTGNNVLATVLSKSNIDSDNGPGPANYHQQTFNLLPYAGQTIRVYFNSANDDSIESYFLVDDVSVQVTTSSTPPANDLCANAIPMTAGTTYTANTANATSTNEPVPDCQGTAGKGVWYTYTPAASGTVTIGTCGSTFDTVLEVYTGSCGSLTPLICNDDNGPACSGSQASVSFAATGGTTYYILAAGSGGASGTLNILASGPGGLIITPTFDSSITSDPQAATIMATINSALAVYQNSFSDPVTVTITFKEMGGGLGQSSTYYSGFSYSSYRAALASHATTSDDTAALAHLPNQSSNPVNGNSTINLSLPLARVLGYSGVNPPPGATDGTIFLNTSIMNLSLSTTNPTKYSLFGTVCHEVDEVLGFLSSLNGLNNGDPAPVGPISPADLFRYDALGNRSFDTGVGTAAYFSIDGTTDLVRYNQQQGGDFQDWFSYPFGAAIPRVQDAFSGTGSQPVPTVELRVLDVIGYARVLPPRPTLSIARSGNNVVLAWPATATGYTLQSSSNVLSGVWATVSGAISANGNYYVTNSASGPKNFYRLSQ